MMKRWVIAQTMLSTTTVRVPVVVLSIPLLEQRRSFPHYNSSRQVHTNDTENRTCNSVSGGGVLRSKLPTTTTVPFLPWFGGSKHRNITARTFGTLRGGSSISDDDGHSISDSLLQQPNTDQEFTILSHPAPGSPFHYAFPVHDLELAKEFYGNVLGCVEGRSSTKWQDYSLHGHQIVAHWVGNNYRCQDYYNPVDGDEVPVPRTYK